MTWVIVGLGNPSEKYANTRHNAGRMAVQHFVKEKKLDEWKEDAKKEALVARGSVEGALAVFVLPETFMNKSGSAVGKFVKSVKAAEKLIVVYDELDLPLGVIKMSFNRGSGGHKGIESIARAVKTKAFWRIRVGVTPATAAGTMKKPHGEKEVNDFILGAFKPHEKELLSKVFKNVSGALTASILDGPVKAMNKFN